jgi:hypothetical protein
MSDLDAQYRTDGDDTGNWPNIGDYWPDAPHRMGPEADYRPDEEDAGPASPIDPAPTRLISPPARPGRSWLRIFLAALGALVFLGGSVIVLARLVTQGRDTDSNVSAPATQQTTGQNAGGGELGGVAQQPSPPVSVVPEPSATATSPQASASASGSPSPSATALPFMSGTFELTGSVVDLNVTVSSLGNDAIRVSAPSGSGLHPRATVDGNTLKLSPNPEGKKGSGRLDVRLNSRIAWALKMTGGVTDGSFDLTGADLRRIDLVGGATRIEMALPSPASGIPIRMSGGVSSWNITTQEEVPLRVLLRQGGGVVELNGQRSTGIKRGTLLSADGAGDGGLAIDAVAGLGELTVAPAGD